MAAKNAVSVAFNGINGASSRVSTLRTLRIASQLNPIQASGPRRLPQTPFRSSVRYASSNAEGDKVAKTGLYDLHASNGAKFVPFGGYQMPVQYGDLSINDSHKWTRENASLFDVGHMVQHYFSGPGAQAFLESITPASLSTVEPFNSGLSALLHRETGGIVDDTIITRLPDKFYVVTNAGCREKDLAYFTAELESWRSNSANPAVEWEVLENQGLVALQGPKAAAVLEKVLDKESAGKLKSLYFGQSMYAHVSTSEAEILVSRGGYTGEDGFEVSIPSYATEAVTQFILESGKDEVRLAGLGARDTLRLEAGMCLYGHDLNDDTTPVEAALSWIIGKDRRAKGGFHGDSVILKQLKKKSEGGGVTRRRVGFIVEGSPAREGADIVDQAGEVVGKITSGCPSPTLKKNIAMGYIKDGLHKSGTEVGIIVRNKKRNAVVTKMPFVPSKYYKAA
ncbi:glycine cleavage system T protein [Aaosphaeria arxii CBS 175.79]|uniref:Aminomethyltransferase n=1 Tax=Aaosphaeria arxii CBS 175.79 TaxID=1450172 RepID=A0A6A5XZN0_9PLEO|nr:glycine cleavage system T protein [Aaosphaeria arxii CBS 175.79]KAF2018662.1 glycine cleavage system T protein [Aaosphaeria arxii CBS 175.79]